MHALEIYDPSGATEVTRLHAPRLDGLAGKTIGFLSNDMWQAHRMLPLLRGWLGRHHPETKLIAETEFPMGTSQIDRDETVAQIQARGVDAVIIGNAS